MYRQGKLLVAMEPIIIKLMNIPMAMEPLLHLQPKRMKMEHYTIFKKGLPIAMMLLLLLNQEFIMV